MRREEITSDLTKTLNDIIEIKIEKDQKLQELIKQGHPLAIGDIIGTNMLEDLDPNIILALSEKYNLWIPLCGANDALRLTMDQTGLWIYKKDIVSPEYKLRNEKLITHSVCPKCASEYYRKLDEFKNHSS